MSAIAINTRVATRCAVPAGTPLIERVCSYCRDVLGWVVCSPENDGERSHGACRPCAEGEMAKLRAASALMSREYTLEIGTAGKHPATQAATPCGGNAGAVNTNAMEALRGPVSDLLPAVSGADEADAPISRGSVLLGPSENAPGEQAFLTTNGHE